MSGRIDAGIPVNNSPKEDLTMKTLKVLLAIAISAGFTVPLRSNPGAESQASDAAFAKLKSLQGQWQGKTSEGGTDTPATTSFRIVSDGSAILDVLEAGTPHEMVTMFHMDGKDLLATHYCAVHNQPRFRYVASTQPNVVTFEFKDATNLASPSDPHMVGIKITILDANHHYEDWTFSANGKSATSRFDFHR
jgi:hypothetical protein